MELSISILTTSVSDSFLTASSTALVKDSLKPHHMTVSTPGGLANIIGTLAALAALVAVVAVVAVVVVVVVVVAAALVAVVAVATPLVAVALDAIIFPKARWVVF